MQTYTVILLYPDYVSDNYPETHMSAVEAVEPEAAVIIAREMCVADNELGQWEDPDGEEYINLDDFAVIAVIAGTHDDLNPYS